MNSFGSKILFRLLDVCCYKYKMLACYLYIIICHCSSCSCCEIVPKSGLSLGPYCRQLSMTCEMIGGVISVGSVSLVFRNVLKSHLKLAKFSLSPAPGMTTWQGSWMSSKVIYEMSHTSCLMNIDHTQMLK